MAAITAPTITPVVRNFAQLRRCAQPLGPKRLAVVVADDEVALTAADAALHLAIALPVLIGNAPAIRARAESLGLYDLSSRAEFVDAAADAATVAVRMAHAGEVDVLLKGHLRTDELLHAVLDRTAGLRTGRLLSDVLLYEDKLARELRLVGISDGGLNVLPNLEQKKQIVQNAIDVMHCIGLTRPKIAIMSATEAVSESVPSSVDAKLLTQMGEAAQFGEAEVFGPLALDCALLESAAREKGIRNSIAGHADCMIVPNIEAGNLLGKSVKYLGGSQCAHVVAGAQVPILIPSRVESVDDKVNSIALGVMFAGR
ncbi:MAG TPA: phosphate acyltransferase [Candidatus Binatia bacterium]|nr:phosphate acyltransferase [Candidatus Binatia bacterium]